MTSPPGNEKTSFQNNRDRQQGIVPSLPPRSKRYLGPICLSPPPPSLENSLSKLIFLSCRRRQPIIKTPTPPCRPAHLEPFPPFPSSPFFPKLHKVRPPFQASINSRVSDLFPFFTSICRLPAPSSSLFPRINQRPPLFHPFEMTNCSGLFPSGVRKPSFPLFPPFFFSTLTVIESFLFSP